MISSHRRRVLVSVGAAVAASALAPSRSWAQTSVKLGYPLPQNSQYGAGASAFQEELAKHTGGRFAVREFPSSALGGEREMIEGLQLGVQEIALVSTGATGNFVPESAIFDLPFLFRDYAHAHQVLDGAIGTEMLARFTDKKLIALAWGEGGFRQITNNKHPVREAGDLRGLKIRTQENPIHMAAFKAMGAMPTPINWPETFAALQQRTVDGQDNPVSVIENSKLYQVQKHLSITRHLYSPAVLLVSPAFYEKLSTQDRQAFANAARAAAAAMRKRVASDEVKGVSNLKQQGMEVVENVDRASFAKAVAPAYEDFNKRFGAPNIERIRKVGA